MATERTTAFKPFNPTRPTHRQLCAYLRRPVLVQIILIALLK
ncbi:MAG: hypothetical protein RMY34_13140 [Aulosira sp. DedQUE10]|nr:hypothetical protein [Aulosira sp. DedQUE10]